MSLVIGMVSTFFRKGSVLANRARLHLLGREVSLLIGPGTTFIRKGSVFVNRAAHYIYSKGKCPC